MFSTRKKMTKTDLQVCRDDNRLLGLLHTLETLRSCRDQQEVRKSIRISPVDGYPHVIPDAIIVHSVQLARIELEIW